MHLKYKESYYDHSSRCTVNQQRAGTQCSHSHDVGTKTSTKQSQDTHEDQRPGKRRKTVYFFFYFKNKFTINPGSTNLSYDLYK